MGGDCHGAALNKFRINMLSAEQGRSQQRAAPHRQNGYLNLLPIPEYRRNMDARFYVCVVSQIGVYLLEKRKLEKSNYLCRQC